MTDIGPAPGAGGSEPAATAPPRPPRRDVAKWAVHGIERLVGPRRSLGFELLRLRLRGRLEDELLLLDTLVEDRELAVDVGANRGYYTYQLAKLFKRVEAFEPIEEVMAALRAVRFPNVRLHPVALSQSEGERRLYIPSVGTARRDGWSSFDRENLPLASQVEERTVQTRTLDSFGFSGVSFLKVDVEGHEVEVLQGAARTIEQGRPVILCEVKDRNRAEVLVLLGSLGYSPWQLRGRRLEALAPEAVLSSEHENFVFRPAERAR